MYYLRKWGGEMGNTNTAYTYFVGGGFSVIAYLVGGFDNLILSLTIMMGVDFISGIMIGAKEGYEQARRVEQTGVAEPEKQGISSNKAFFGIMKKVSMLLAIVVAVQLDIIMGNEGDFMRNALILSFIGMEGISFVENMSKLGLSLPQPFIDAFAQLKQNKKYNKPPGEEGDK